MSPITLLRDDMVSGTSGGNSGIQGMLVLTVRSWAIMGCSISSVDKTPKYRYPGSQRRNGPGREMSHRSSRDK